MFQSLLSQSFTADITSPIKDTIFPEDDELPMSAEQAEKAEAEMKMKNKILRCFAPSIETKKFESAMEANISTFKPYDDDENLEVLRETHVDSGIRYFK